MALIKSKPNTPGTRQLVLVDRKGLWKGKPLKKLTVGLSKPGGRNNKGRVTMRHKGGGHKNKYRLIDFKRNKLDIAATVERIEYDPNRTAYIAIYAVLFGSYSILSTVAAISSLFLLKSINLYLFL